MKKINILITNSDIAKEMEGFFEHHELKYLFFPNCKGYSSDESFFEFIGFSEKEYNILIFNATEFQTKAIERFILKNFNEKNNGIMFTIKGDGIMEENVLYVAVVNSGFGEKVMDTIRNKAHIGSSLLEARGTGKRSNELFGMPIDSGKELVLSVMPAELVAGVKRQVKKDFKDANTDVVSFILPVDDFTKMHN